MLLVSHEMSRACQELQMSQSLLPSKKTLNHLVKYGGRKNTSKEDLNTFIFVFKSFPRFFSVLYFFLEVMVSSHFPYYFHYT